jgi:hypothetical protein
MDADPMMRPAIAVTGLATSLLLACAAPAREMTLPPPAAGTTVAQAHILPHQDHPMTAAAQGQPLLVGARDAAQRVLSFLSDAQSSTDFTVPQVEQRMGVTLTPDPSNGEGWTVYHSPDLGGGWSYGVQQATARPPLGPAFGFWFEHADRAANPAPICALPLDQLRASLTAHGWVERTVPSEIGSVLAIEFAKHELVLTLTPRDIALSGDAKCVLSLQASGGH